MRNHSLELHPEPPPASQVINQSQFSENHGSWGPLGTSQQSDFGGSQDASNGSEARRQPTGLKSSLSRERGGPCL